jgi:hypothetical protein
MLFNTFISRLSPYVNKTVEEHEFAFWNNRSTTDHIFFIHQILEKNWENNHSVHELFKDCNTSYDLDRMEILYNSCSCSWLSWKGAGSSANGVTEYFLILPVALDPGVDSDSNRNEYKKTFLGVKHGQCIRLTTSLPSVSRLSRQCGILNIS